MTKSTITGIVPLDVESLKAPVCKTFTPIAVAVFSKVQSGNITMS